MFYEKCKRNVWHQEFIGDELLGNVPTMLSRGERVMLHWLAREFPSDGHIIDAGCFLGGSTLPLASGLKLRGGGGKVHSYDMFLAGKDAYSLGLMGHGKKRGETVLDLFGKSIEDYAAWINVYAGDIMTAGVPNAPVDILFVDVAKSREINRKIVREFFPLMTPGRSVLIQQDYNDHSCQWINATMELLKDSFERLTDEMGSRVYRYVKPTDFRSVDIPTKATLQEKQLLEAAIAGETGGASRYFSALGLGWTLFELEGVSAALSYLDNLPFPQPWESDQSYIGMIRGVMANFGDMEKLDGFYADYFSKA
jgi:hypothetical protein